MRQQPLIVVGPESGELLFGLRLEGEPVPWQRPKPFRMGNKTVQRFVDPYLSWRTTAIWQVARWWNSRPTLRCPLKMEVVAVMRRPPSVPSYTIDGHATSYPWEWTDGRNPSLAPGDADNFGKGVADVLQRTPAGRWNPFTKVISDDRLVIDTRSRKVYAGIDETPAIEIRCWKA